MTSLNEYLRRKSGLEPAVSRVGDSGHGAEKWTVSTLWTAHEPAAQKAGLPQEVIDIVNTANR